MLKKNSASSSVRLASFVLCLIFAFSLALVGCGQQAQQGSAQPSSGGGDAQVTLKFAHNHPPTSASGAMHEFLGKTIEEESGGTIKVEMYPSGSLVTDPDALDNILSGNIDIYQFNTSTISPVLKEMIYFEIPGLYPYKLENFRAFNDVCHPILHKIFAKYNVKYLGALPQVTMGFATTGKLLQSIDDFKGLRIRAAGKWAGETLLKYGATPVTMPIGDVPTALERNTVDSVYTAHIAIQNFKMHESAHHITVTDQAESLSGIMMSQKSWDKLSDAQRAAIDRSMEKYWDHCVAGYVKAIDEFNQELSVAPYSYYYLSDAENAVLRALTEELLPQAKEIAGDMADEIVAAFNKLK